MRRTFILGFALLGLLYSSSAPAPDFKVVQLDMAEACGTVFGICSTNPKDHSNLKNPAWMAAQVPMNTAGISSAIAVFLLVASILSHLTGTFLYRCVKAGHARLTRID